MYNPYSLDTLRLGRDPSQSLSTFYNGVQKLEHFEDTNLTILARERHKGTKNWVKNRRNFL